MTTTKEVPVTPKWNLKEFIKTLRETESKDPSSLEIEELAILEIIDSGSPEHAALRKLLVAFFKKHFQRDLLMLTLAAKIEALASARKRRPSKAQVKLATEAGAFDWSPEQWEVARNAISSVHRNADVMPT